VQLLASQPKVFLVFLCLVLTPTIVRVASDTSQPLAPADGGDPDADVLHHGADGAHLRQRAGPGHRAQEPHRRTGLALRLEMAVADEGRRAAEAASRAKTQFFAAASHDLRQPLHAMGLFAEALRQRSHDPEVASLVNSINESVDALEGLFGELLDITRIDTGGVEVNPAPVRLRELFARLRLHFEPTAFEKGLMLSFRGEQHVAQADPVLLERVLRNLVSNAIRYTDDGGVLVSCRCAREPTAATCCCRCGTAASASPNPACRASGTSSTRRRATARWRRTTARAWAWAWPSSSAWRR
jgi:signal transduction histidine kinase